MLKKYAEQIYWTNKFICWGRLVVKKGRWILHYNSRNHHFIDWNINATYLLICSAAYLVLSKLFLLRILVIFFDSYWENNYCSVSKNQTRHFRIAEQIVCSAWLFSAQLKHCNFPEMDTMGMLFWGGNSFLKHRCFSQDVWS